MSKTEELLAVLDLPKEELDEWLRTTFQAGIAQNNLPHYITISSTSTNLAALAFRLRNEAFRSAKGKAAWCRGCRIVIKAVNNSDEFPVWSQPIHWIIAALMAKQKEKEE